MDSIDRFFINKRLKDRDILFRIFQGFIQFYWENKKKTHLKLFARIPIVIHILHLLRQTLINPWQIVPFECSKSLSICTHFILKHKQLFRKQKLIQNVKNWKFHLNLLKHIFYINDGIIVQLSKQNLGHQFFLSKFRKTISRAYKIKWPERKDENPRESKWEIWKLEK